MSTPSFQSGGSFTATHGRSLRPVPRPGDRVVQATAVTKRQDANLRWRRSSNLRSNSGSASSAAVSGATGAVSGATRGSLQVARTAPRLRNVGQINQQAQFSNSNAGYRSGSAVQLSSAPAQIDGASPSAAQIPDDLFQRSLRGRSVRRTRCAIATIGFGRSLCSACGPAGRFRSTRWTAKKINCVAENRFEKLGDQTPDPFAEDKGAPSVLMPSPDSILPESSAPQESNPQSLRPQLDAPAPPSAVERDMSPGTEIESFGDMLRNNSPDGGPAPKSDPPNDFDQDFDFDALPRADEVADPFPQRDLQADKEDLDRLNRGLDDSTMGGFDTGFDVSGKAPNIVFSCDEFRDRISEQTIDQISLDISPPYRPRHHRCGRIRTRKGGVR